MKHLEFQRLAIASFIASQEENGSWLNDSAATCRALEVLLEDIYGPMAAWRHSWIGSYLRGEGISSWPMTFPHDLSIRREEVNRQELATVWKGMRFGRAAGFDQTAIVRAVQWLVSAPVITWWEDLRSYQQIGVLLTLKRLSSTHLFDDLFESLEVASQRMKRDVFISYGGPDRDFAHRLAKDLESGGIRVWFAEWGP